MLKGILGRKSTLYFTLIASITSLYFFTVYLLGEAIKLMTGVDQYLVTVPAVLFFSMLLHPIMFSAQEYVDRRFSKARYESDVIVRKFSHNVKKMISLPRLAEYITRAAYVTFKLTGASTFVFDEEKQGFICLAGSGNMACMRGKTISKDLTFIRVMSVDGRSVVPEWMTAENTGRKSSAKIIEEMKELGIQIAVPSVTRRKAVKLLGFLAAGSKKFEDEFSQDDILLLETLSSQVALGIENALMYEKRSDSSKKIMEIEKLSDLGRATAGVARQAQKAMMNIEDFAKQFPERTSDREFLERAAGPLFSEVERMRLLMQGVLEYSKPSSHSLKEFDLTKLVNETVLLIKEDAESRKINIVCDIPETVMITSDKRTMKQAILNVLLNAVEAMPGGGGLKIKVIEKNGEIRLTVEDTGIGIDPDKIEKIFEPFYSTKEYGIGLGLTIAKSNLKAIGSKINIRSNPEEGTKVEITAR